MPQPKKKAKAKKKNDEVSIEESQEVQESKAEMAKALRCNHLVLTIRESEDENEINAAFEEIAARLKPRIGRLVNRFNISGLGPDDIMQEALYALRYKAIKDYDAERGNGEGWSPFDKFSILCIRRHLSTEYKSSYQNKKRVLNHSISLNYESKSSNNNDLSLINIIPSGETDVLSNVMTREYYRDLMTKLLGNLSDFEKEVFLLYAQRYSYEEIAEKINKVREEKDQVLVDIKGVDNALSRIKNKAKAILSEYDKKDHDPLE